MTTNDIVRIGNGKVDYYVVEVVEANTFLDGVQRVRIAYAKNDKVRGWIAASELRVVSA
jgi:hypothetical protein